MLSKEQHDIVKAAAEILRAELELLAPTSPEGEAGKLLIYKFGSFVIKKAKARTVKFIRGLQQPRFGMGVRSAFGPFTGKGVMSPRNFVVFFVGLGYLMGQGVFNHAHSVSTLFS